MAIGYVTCTYNVSLYQQLHKKLQEAVGWVQHILASSDTTSEHLKSLHSEVKSILKVANNDVSGHLAQ